MMKVIRIRERRLTCLWRILCFAWHLQAYFQDIPEEDFRGWYAHPGGCHAPHRDYCHGSRCSVMTEGATADAWLRRFWQTPLHRRKWRYYDNCLYFFCLML